MKTLQTKQTTTRRFSLTTVALVAVMAAAMLAGCSKSEPQPLPETPTATDGTIRAVARVENSIEVDTKAPNNATSADGMQVYAFAWNSFDNDFTTTMVATGTMTFNAGTDEADAVTFDPGFTGTNLLPLDKSRLFLKANYPANGWITGKNGQKDPLRTEENDQSKTF